MADSGFGLGLYNRFDSGFNNRLEGNFDNRFDSRFNNRFDGRFDNRFERELAGKLIKPVGGSGGEIGVLGLAESLMVNGFCGVELALLNKPIAILNLRQCGIVSLLLRGADSGCGVKFRIKLRFH